MERPAWLSMAVHVVNSVVAWLDLLIGEGRCRVRAGCLHVHGHAGAVPVA